MRWVAAALLSVVAHATAATLPPAYPRAGATKILDNDRVQVWNIAWLKGQPSPLHRHVYDLVGVYYEPGDRMIISPEGAKRPVSIKAWDIAFQKAGVTVLRVRDQVADAVRYGLSAANRYSISAASSAEKSSAFAPVAVRTTAALKMPRFRMM